MESPSDIDPHVGTTPLRSDVSEPSTATEKPNIYVIRVSLLNFRPTIWRRVELSSRTTLHQFHGILQIVMGWENYHLHEFQVRKKRFGVPNPQFDPPKVFSSLAKENKVPLSEVLPRVNRQIRYLYNMDDPWTHQVKLSKIVAVKEGMRYPRLVTGSGSCPPEDCRGPKGYEALLNVLNQKEHVAYSFVSDYVRTHFRKEMPPTEEINQTLHRQRSLRVRR